MYTVGNTPVDKGQHGWGLLSVAGSVITFLIIASGLRWSVPRLCNTALLGPAIVLTGHTARSSAAAAFPGSDNSCFFGFSGTYLWPGCPVVLTTGAGGVPVHIPCHTRYHRSFGPSAEDLSLGRERCPRFY
ncbi:hypothetical protein ES708_28009 [subsurface metagenome]